MTWFLDITMNSSHSRKLRHVCVYMYIYMEIVCICIYIYANVDTDLDIEIDIDIDIVMFISPIFSGKGNGQSQKPIVKSPT